MEQISKYIYSFSYSEAGKLLPQGVNDSNKVNYSKLYIQIFGSEIPGIISVKGIEGEIYCAFNQALQDTELSSTDPLLPGLIQIINYHDGAEPETSEHKQSARRKGFDKVVQTAKYHPDLTAVEINAYLTSIDNYKNSYITDGEKANLIGKVFFDAGSHGDPTDTRTQAEKEAHPHYAFLNRIVNTEGVMVWQFLIDQIGKILEV